MTGNPLMWHKITQAQYPEAENFLRQREAFCVSACSRFMHGNSGHIWTYNKKNGEAAAFLLHSRRTLFPIFQGDCDFPLPGFLGRFLRKVSVYSVQGLKQDAEILEAGMKTHGFSPSDSIDYDLMTLDKMPLPGCFNKGPQDLILRAPEAADKKELFELQSAYEKEEVIPANGFFSPGNCQKTLERLMNTEKMLVACLGGRVIGKINTNAASFTRFQIGGVYVRPELRGHGIAVKMSAVFLKELVAEGRGITLFVKKRNAAARNVYSRLGFTIRGDYRISYF